jgi:hypothetical protein
MNLQKQTLLRMIHFPQMFFTVAVFMASALACTAEDRAPVKFDSAHSLALDARIYRGVLVVPTSSTEVEIKHQVEAQLKFSIGQLNGTDAVSGLSSLKLDILQLNPLPADESEVIYAAHFLVSWPKERDIPSSQTVVLPERASKEALKLFFSTYGNLGTPDHQCMEGTADAAVSSTFWYYYRPLADTCILKNLDEQQDLVFKALLDLKLSDENTTGKFPEYGKIWEDDELIVTTIFGKTKSGALDTKDAGIYTYQAFYGSLVELFGEPLTSSLQEGQLPDAINSNVSLTFSYKDRVVDVQMFLVDSMLELTDEVKAQYNKRTQNSDFISYSGHSGYGENIRQLAKLGQFQPDQYQIFLVNGCDTFAYVDESLKKAHALVNPDHAEDKFVDIITNAMPSYFSANAHNNSVIIKSLAEQVLNYREILELLPTIQRAAVLGEQDNLWPLPFEEAPEPESRFLDPQAS